tara:strand:- start:315 stop:626 length:312 start_codon:yes stop_codon:yes gene_type:complete
MYVHTPPTFEVNDDLIDTIHGPIKDQLGFSERILEFVEYNLTGNGIEKILCYLLESDGTILIAKLHRSGYFKSLEKCLEYYSEDEKYEKCNKIKNLIKKYELR